MNEQPPRLNQIHHVAIICSNYARSKHFYVEILGLTIIAENFRIERNSYKLDLALPDGGQLELFSFPTPPTRPSRPEACGLRHLAFAVSNLDEWKNYLADKNVGLEDIRIDEFTQKRFVFFKDPDDLPIELYEIS